MAEAWGDVPVHSVQVDLGGGREFSFRAATSDGKWLIGASMPEDFGSGSTSIEPSDAVLVRVSDGAVRVMATMEAARSQMLSASSDDRWVVWNEGGFTEGPNPRLMVFDRQSGRVRELARTAIDGGGLASAGSVSHDLVVWGEVVGPYSREHPFVNHIIREGDLRTGAVRTLATRALSPILSWPWITWQTADDSGVFTLVANLETGQQERLDVYSPVMFAMHRGSTAYATATSTHGYQTLCLIDDLADAGNSRVIMSDPDADIEWITLNDRAIAFRNQPLTHKLGEGPTQVYDRQLNILVDLPIDAGFSGTTSAGPLVVWVNPTGTWDSPATSYRVVDTREIAR